jgi:hypothetical protein
MTWTTPSPTEIPYAEDGDPRALWPATSQAVAERLHELVTPLYAGGVVIGGAAVGGGSDIPWGAGFAGDPFGMVGDTIVYNGATRMFLITLQVQVGGTGSSLISRAGLGTASGAAAFELESVQSGDVGASGTSEHSHHVSMVTLMGPDNVTTLVAGVAAQDGAASPSIAYNARIQIVGL